MTFKVFWNTLTQTKALENSSGELETLFFESVYRVAYIIGMSDSDSGLYIIYSTMVKFSISMLFISEISYMILDTNNFDDVAASLNVILLQMIALYRYINMLSHRTLYRKLAVAMESETFDITTKNRRSIVEQWSCINENYLKLLLGLGNLSLVPWFVYPLVDDVEYNLFFGLKLPVNYNNPRGYVISYVILMIAFCLVAQSVMVMDIRMQAHFLHIVCQFNVLADCFQNIVEDCKNRLRVDNKLTNMNSYLHLDPNFKETYKQRLRGLVEQHKLLLRLSLKLRESLSGPMLGQLAASGILICFVGYQTVTTGTENVTKCLMSLLFLGYNLFGFYIVCRWSEEIKTQSGSISTAVYCSKWETGFAIITTVKSSLIMVIARAQKPVIMTAGGMYDLSLTSYSSLVRTSYSALTVLLGFRN
ncbi:odorant receptor 13a-like [Amyelois transitella]|uniref:odorant receptor 13a-like n=1 Tax=Amyelois transitella TaxID=680683 RepID=UPI0029902C91|nr:odorant receptor 13a-like [Amyelois transitella]